MSGQSKKPKQYVVVADNSHDSCKLVCRLVKQLNCVAIPAASATEILFTLGNHEVDLVLLDLDFDKVRKANTLYEIKQLAPMVPVVVMGQVMTPVLFRRLCERGVQSFLQKPVERNQLAMTLYRNLW